MVLPQHRVEPDEIVEVAVELVGDRLHAPALGRHIGRRGDKNIDDAHSARGVHRALPRNAGMLHQTNDRAVNKSK